MARVDSKKLYKEFHSTTPFPSPESIIFEEIAGIIDTVETQYSTFRDNFRPNEKQAHLFKTYYGAEDGLQVYLLYGGAGSGKTTAGYGLLTDIALRNPGVQILAVRHTYTEIEDSLVPSLEEFWNRYNIDFKCKRAPAPTYDLPNNSRISMRSEIRSSKSGNDKADALGSTQYSVIYINEADNTARQYFMTCIGRMRQRKLYSKPVIILDCNPPSEDNWVYQMFFVEHKPEDVNSNFKVFHFPIKDNERHVGTQYIQDLVEAYKNYPSLYRKFVEGKFGPNVKGEPIFKDVFRRDLHVCADPPEWNKNLPMLRGWDFGFRRPAVIIAQDDPAENEITIYRATMGSQTLLHPFASHIQRICEQYFPGARWHDYCDPAGDQKKDDGRSSVDVLRSLGIRPKFAPSSIDYGLNIALQCLTQISQKHRPVLQFDPTNASLLIDAFEFGYTHDPDAPPSAKFKPYKDGYYDHLMDALRYMLIHIRKFTAGIKHPTKGISREKWLSKDKQLFRSNRLNAKLKNPYSNGETTIGHSFGRNANDFIDNS